MSLKDYNPPRSARSGSSGRSARTSGSGRSDRSGRQDRDARQVLLGGQARPVERSAQARPNREAREARHADRGNQARPARPDRQTHPARPTDKGGRASSRIGNFLRGLFSAPAAPGVAGKSLAPRVFSPGSFHEIERPDWFFLGLVLVLLGLGLTMVFSASGVASIRLHDDPYYFFRRQMIFAALGLICMYVAYKIPRLKLEKLQYLMLFGCLALLLLALSPLGVSVNGARRWINLGFIRLQPMEFAKIALVFYLAFFLSTKQHIIKTFSRGIIPPFLITGLFCLLLLAQPDFGGATVMTMLLFFMCLVGGTRLLYLVFSAGLAMGAASLLIIMEPYRFQRLTSFMDPFANAQGSGYQLVQSFYAMGSGGVFGAGLGAGRQKLFYLPEAHTDFIMAVLGEELGLVGVSVVFILLGLLFWRGMRIAMRQQDLRARLTAFGLTLVLAIPMVLNMAVVSGTVPSKGVPMPFFSYGGTSLLSSLICAGFLLNYSRPSRQANQASQSVQSVQFSQSRRSDLPGLSAKPRQSGLIGHSRRSAQEAANA
ncbi:MAG: putative lipid II flippase FtsW [Deltaproteobacteria bacterium]|jgi:cell division protein FtsW|nr:putative lipid II flippase FtsW [Deltaproteobacteria bacterium]